MFPEFYVSYPPEDSDDLAPVYYKVTDYDPEGHVFWQRESMSRPREDTFYDLFLEEKNGFGVERIDKSETPWG
jgi:hypothetical protein